MDTDTSTDPDGYDTIALGDQLYPELLTQLRDPPPLLYIKGNKDVLSFPALAIVGSRNPTSGGARNAFEFSRHLANCGFCIVSGLAQGIDAAAHRGALAAEAPTVAFLGHGIDSIYPAENAGLAAEILKDGAIVSEYPPGTPPLRAYFPQRNRLISGLSLGTLVIEAARRSGSLITARLAAEQGREVFAIPGSIHNPMAKGCHQLLRDGARLVESADDIMAELAPLATHILQNQMESTDKHDMLENKDEEYVKLRATLSHDPAGIDELVERSGLTIDQVSSMLLILELDGKIEKLTGGRYALLH